MFGRRPDGYRIRGIDPVVQITPYVMPMRCDAQVFLRFKADMERLSCYIRKQKLEKGEQLSYMQIVIAAYVRALSQNPEVNRFIMNKRYYARNNCSVAVTVLKDPTNVDLGEAVTKIKFDLTDTIYDVRDRIESAISANRIDQPAGFLDKFLLFLFAVPGLAGVTANTVRILDRYDLVPRILVEELPFYVGMFITNTASIGMHDVNHHLYNWGNVGLFLGLGTTEKLAVIENGQTRMKRFLPIGITADERVCSGAHYARFFADMKYYLRNPELLESAPESIRFEKGCEYHQPKHGQASG